MVIMTIINSLDCYFLNIIHIVLVFIWEFQGNHSNVKMLFSRMSHTFLPQQLLQEVILVNLLVSRSLNLLCYAVIKLSCRTLCLQIHGVLWFPSYNPTLPISHQQIVKLRLVGPPVWIKSLRFELLSRLISANYTWNIC